MAAPHPSASLNRRYRAALICIGVLIVLDQLLIEPELSRLVFDAPVINVSGRQRMLSQRLAKTSLVLVTSEDPATRERHRSDLASIVDLWTKSHEGLQAGSAELNLPGNNPPEVSAAFAVIQPHFLAIRAAADDLLAATAKSARSGDPRVEQAIVTILAHEPDFLIQMDHLVGLYEEETRQHVRQFRRTSWTIAAAILATMWGLHLAAIRPAAKLLERQFTETRDQYQAVVESINEGLMRLDAQGRILFANRQLCQLAGESPGELAGRFASRLFSTSQGMPWETPHALNRGSEPPREMEFVPVQGTPRSCLVSPCQLLDDSQHTSGWVVLVMDIAEQRAAEQRVQALADQLEHADRLKSMGEIAAGLAHEMNQPLGAIANFAGGSLARIESGNCHLEELEQPLRRILAAALRAGGIVRRVKQFSQKRPHTVATAEINALVQETLDLFAPELQRRRIHCELRLNHNPLLIECDALQIGQVLANVLQNALHALEENSADRRRVTIATTAEENDLIGITIEDTGPGFPDAIYNRIFEPFSTSRPDGLGMGLSIVRSIVEAHSGVIRAENRPEGGARLTIQLPSRRPTGEDADSTTAEVGGELRT